jgi:hypothetical protein
LLNNSIGGVHSDNAGDTLVVLALGRSLSGVLPTVETLAKGGCCGKPDSIEKQSPRGAPEFGYAP